MAKAVSLFWRQCEQLTSVWTVSRNLMHTFHRNLPVCSVFRDVRLHAPNQPSVVRLHLQPKEISLLKPHFLTLNEYFALTKHQPITLTVFSRNFSVSSKESLKEKAPKKKRKVPKLILLQNPFKWIMIKIDFSVLRSIWDPSFKEKEFKFGTKQAIARVTQVISDGHYEELNGLLTKAARKSLLRDLERNWNPRKRSLLALDNKDIQISSPRRVYFIRIAEKKFCDVDMAFLALKWVPINNVDSLIFSEIFARFHREYTPHCIPEWTIAYFKVTRLEVIRK